MNKLNINTITHDTLIDSYIDLIDKLDNMLECEISEGVYDYINDNDDIFTKVENEIVKLLPEYIDKYGITDEDDEENCLYNCDAIYMKAICNVLGDKVIPVECGYGMITLADEDNYIDFDYELEYIIEDLVNDAQELGFELNPNRVYFDDSRSWSLYISGYDLDLDVNKFGAYRNYLGGGVRDSICSNGRAEDNTLELAELFEKALKRIENIYNGGYENAESWEQPTGVLL